MMIRNVIGQTIVDMIDFVPNVGDVLGNFGQFLCVLFMFPGVDIPGLARLVDDTYER